MSFTKINTVPEGKSLGKLPEDFLENFPENLIDQTSKHTIITQNYPSQEYSHSQTREYYPQEHFHSQLHVQSQEHSRVQSQEHYPSHEDFLENNFHGNKMQTSTSTPTSIPISTSSFPSHNNSSSHINGDPYHEKWIPDVIVMGPGGMKGFLHLGCLIPFDKIGYFRELKIMIGVSVGSIILLLYLIGYSIEDIIQEGFNLDIEKDFIDFNLQNLKERGLFSLDRLANKLSNVVVKKFGFIPTLLQLYKFTGIHFMVITSELPGAEVRIDHTTDPNLLCVLAVLFSSTIPFVFKPLEYRGKILYDGALTNPYPTNIFDDGKHRILGLYITADEHVEEGIVWLVNTIIRIPMKQLRIVNQHNSSIYVKHIELTSPTMDFTGVTSGIDEKNGMIRSGFLKAIDFLDKEGYDTTGLDVNKYLEIPYVELPDEKVEEKSEIDYNDPERYLTVEVSPHLYDHVSTDQLGYFDPVPDIDFGDLDPEVIEVEDEGEGGSGNKTEAQDKIQNQITELISTIQMYIDKK